MDEPIPCQCGDSDPSIETVVTTATIIECLSCGRMCGGLTEEDAVQLWNDAMSSK